MFFKFFYLLFLGILQGSHICLYIGSSTAWDENSSFFPHASSIQILQILPEKGAALLWDPLTPKPGWARQADSSACGGQRTMLGDGQPEDGGPLPPGASQDRTAFADLPSPFLHPVCRRTGPDLSPPSTVSSQGVTHLGAVYPLNWSHGSHSPLYPQRSWIFRKHQVLATGPGRGSPQG